MKRAIWMTLAVALLLALPAIPQEAAGEEELATKVAELEKKVADQEKLIKEMQSWILTQQGQARDLAKSLRKAEKEGFLLPAPNNDAKKALLQGLKDFAAAASGEQPAAGDEEDEE